MGGENLPNQRREEYIARINRVIDFIERHGRASQLLLAGCQALPRPLRPPDITASRISAEHPLISNLLLSIR